MTCRIHNVIPKLIARKKPHGFFQGRPSWYEIEIWVSSLDVEGIGWADKLSARWYGQILHGELHGAVTLDDALQWKG